jgi:hypothetical protein
MMATMRRSMDTMATRSVCASHEAELVCDGPRRALNNTRSIRQANEEVGPTEAADRVLTGWMDHLVHALDRFRRRRP